MNSDLPGPLMSHIHDEDDLRLDGQLGVLGILGRPGRRTGSHGQLGTRRQTAQKFSGRARPPPAAAAATPLARNTPQKWLWAFGTVRILCPYVPHMCPICAECLHRNVFSALWLACPIACPVACLPACPFARASRRAARANALRAAGFAARCARTYAGTCLHMPCFFRHIPAHAIGDGNNGTLCCAFWHICWHIPCTCRGFRRTCPHMPQSFTKL